MTPPKRVWITLYDDGTPSGVTILFDEAKEWAEERGKTGPFEYVRVPKKPKRKATPRRSTTPKGDQG